jgi:hypothetical protein
MMTENQKALNRVMREAFAHIEQPGHDSLTIRNKDTREKVVICRTCNLVWKKPTSFFFQLLEFVCAVFEKRKTT